VSSALAKLGFPDDALPDDWSDSDCVKILTALSSVMHADSKIVVVDAISQSACKQLDRGLTPRAVNPGPGTNTVDNFLTELEQTDDKVFNRIEPPAPLNNAWDDAKTLRSLDMLMGSWWVLADRLYQR
jgi:hypothetical protein